MEEAQVTPEKVAEVASRFSRLYTGAISDILDKNGYVTRFCPITLRRLPPRIVSPASHSPAKAIHARTSRTTTRKCD